MRQDKTIGREEKFRLNLWLEKKFEIERHNQLFYRVCDYNLVNYIHNVSLYLYHQGEVTYSQTLNQFSDLTAQEFAEVNGFRGMEVSSGSSV